jgi:MYXO-CTERM domain-containing protein
MNPNRTSPIRRNFLRLPLLTSIAFATISMAEAQDVLAKWTFELSPFADLTDSATISGIVADTGIFSASSFASGVHASSLTDWTTPSGNGSVNSFSANNWAVGDYFQFATSTVGYEDLTLTWDQVGSSTGPRDFDLLYSSDGTNFTVVPGFDNYVVLLNSAPNNWSSGTPITTTTYTADLSSIVALEGASNVYFRLVVDSLTAINNSPIATGGTDRVDNFTVTAVPEPSSAAMAVMGGLALLGARRRRGSK